MKKIKDYIEYTQLKTVIEALLAAIKNWVLSITTDKTLIITDGNWATYIDTYANDTNNIKKYYLYKTSITYSSNNTVVNSNPFYASNKLDPSIDFQTSMENLKNELKNFDSGGATSTLLVKDAVLLLPPHVKTVQFATNLVNFENLKIYPPSYRYNNLPNRGDGDSVTLDNKYNGYEISVFELPAGGMYESTSTIVNEKITQTNRKITFSSNRGSNHISFRFGSLFYNNVMSADTNTIKPVTKSYMEQDLVDITTTNLRDELDGRIHKRSLLSSLSYSSLSNFENVVSFDYTDTYVNGWDQSFRLKPGCVAQLKWFNGFWYTMGCR